MFSYVSPEARVPADHPLRPIRTLVDDVLRDMSREFDGSPDRRDREQTEGPTLPKPILLAIVASSCVALCKALDIPRNPRSDGAVGLCFSGAISARPRGVTRRRAGPHQKRGPRRRPSTEVTQKP